MPFTVTDALTIAAIIIGPIVSVQISQALDRQRGDKERKLKLFKTLMSTRSVNLAPAHIEALNMIDVEFDTKKAQEKPVVEAWKVYLDHLNDKNYPKEAWGARRVDLQIDLLQKMAISLGYDFDKSHIRNTSYYPHGYGELEDDQYVLRKGTIELLQGNRPISVRVIENKEEN